MEKKEYLSEEEYQKNAKKLKKIGLIVLIIGIIVLIVGTALAIVGFVGFGNSPMQALGSDYVDTGVVQDVAGAAMKNMVILIIGSILSMIGLGLTAVGGVLMFVAHGREIKSFATQQAMPIAQEGIEKMTPTVSNAAESISKGVAKGIAEGKKEAATDDEIEHL